jgi:anti-sigma B factor antagonist
MELEISREQMPDGIGGINVAGELDLYTAPRLKEELLATLEDGALKVIVDMSGVNFIDSSALGVLIGGVKRLKPKDGRMVLVIIDDNVNWIFRITGLNNVFDIYPTREEAVASFS